MEAAVEDVAAREDVEELRRPASQRNGRWVSVALA